jgi:hypothetical protein
VFGAGARDAEGVGLLEGVAADELGGDLPGQRYDRNRVHHRVHQACCEVRCAGPGSGAANSYFSSAAGVPFGGEGRVFLVPYQHVADVVVVKRIVKRKGDAARISEHAIDPFPGQALQQHFRAAHQRRHRLRLTTRYKRKRPSARLSAPLMAFGTLVPAASDGAGYDDYKQNNNAYGNNNGAGQNRTQANCNRIAHV